MLQRVADSETMFTDPSLLHLLEATSDTELDALPFGVIKMDKAGIVVAYNLFESAAAGISPDRVIGFHCFTVVAPCTNNYMVASRFEDELELDVAMDYVFTLRMRATPVRLRLLKSADVAHMYMLVTWQ